MDWRTYYFYNKNGTIQVVTEETPTSVASGVIIIVCFLFGVGYNFIVSTAILSSDNLRSSSFHIVLLLISVTCFLDCLINESIAFGYLFSAQTAWCSLSATVFQFFLFTHSTALSLLWLERAVAVREHPVTAKVCLGGVILVLIFGVIFVSPLYGASEIHYFPNRNACSAVRNNSWIPIFNLLGFLFNWCFTVTSCAICIYSIKKYHEDQNQLTVLTVFPLSNAESQNHSRHPFTTCNKNKISFTVLFLYLILILPQIISVTVTLFFNPSFEPDPWIDPRIAWNEIRSVSTNSLEPLFVYSRYMYNVVIPITILSSDRDTRVRGRLVLCCKRNEIGRVNSSFVREPNMTRQNEGLQLTVTPSSMRTPVLFATPGGLYLRVPQGLSGADNSENTSASDVNLRLVSVFCDLTINSNSELKGSVEEKKEASFIEKDEVQVLERSPKGKKFVNFSSKVDAIPPMESGVWSAPEEVSSRSDTRVIDSPLFVKGDKHLRNSPGETYSKIS